MNQLIAFKNGQIEVGTGEPGYKWVQAYSIKFQDGGVSNPMTLSNIRGMAKRDGQKLIIFETEEAAIIEQKKGV